MAAETSTEPAGDAVRTVKAISLGGIEPAMAEVGPPVFESVDPATLLVDEAYQRNLSERSIRLVRQIIGGWDWRRFKPPVCARTPRGLEVIDGQHTAIAAASHPQVSTIPVMIVEAAEQADRAQAFIGHNRDRLGITPMQMHAAAAAGGDPDAVTLNQVCERAGVRVLRATPGNGVWRAGETVAVRAIGALINRRGAMRARQVLEILTAARSAPIASAQIKAVEALLHDPEFSGEIEPAAVTSALITLGSAADQEAAVFAATHKVPQWRALAIVLFRKGRRRKARAAA